MQGNVAKDMERIKGRLKEYGKFYEDNSFYRGYRPSVRVIFSDEGVEAERGDRQDERNCRFYQ